MGTIVVPKVFLERKKMLVQMTVKGQKRNVSLERQLDDGGYLARVRASNGNSIRGKAKKNTLGVWRFTPSNPRAL